MRVGKINPSETGKKVEKNNSICCTGPTYRRPFGVGVLPLNDITHYDSSIESEEKEYNFKVGR